MTVAELIKKIKSLHEDENAEIYLDIQEGEFGFRADFNIYLDSDNDLVIRF